MSSNPGRPGSLVAPLLTGVGAMVGTGLGWAFEHLARAAGSRPLHPRGVVAEGTLTIHPHAAIGVDALDSVGDHPCTLRLSRAVGTPTGRPDIGGLALRLPGAGVHDTHADLLFASTGLGPVARHVLAARRRIDQGALTTLWPYLTPTGPTMVAAVPLSRIDEDEPSGARFAVGAAHGRQGWTRIGSLVVGARIPDPPMRFDTVAHPLRGARQYPWVAAIRARTYGGARAGWTGGQTTSMGR